MVNVLSARTNVRQHYRTFLYVILDGIPQRAFDYSEDTRLWRQLRLYVCSCSKFSSYLGTARYIREFKSGQILFTKLINSYSIASTEYRVSNVSFCTWMDGVSRALVNCISSWTGPWKLNRKPKQFKKVRRLPRQHDDQVGKISWTYWR